MKRLLLLFILAQVAYSQQDSIKTYELNEITIRSDKYQSLIKNLNPSQQLIEVKGVNLSVQKNLIAYLKHRSAGIFVSEFGNYGFGIGQQAAGKFSIRGFNGQQQITIYIDGHPEYAGIFGHPVSDIYSTDAISDVIIIKGPSSLIYGSGALAGVIDIRTSNSFSNGTSFGSDLSYGSYNTFNISLKSAFSTQTFSSSINIFNYTSDNHRSSSNYNSKGIGLTIGYKMNKFWSFNLKSNIRYAKVYNPGTVNNPFAKDSVWTEFTRSNLSLNFQNRYKSTEGNYTIYYNSGVHDLFDGFHSIDYVAGINARQTAEISNNFLLTAGNDTRIYGGDARNIRKLIDTTLYETGFYFVAEAKIIQNLKFIAGARLNYHEVYGSEFIPQASLNYTISKNADIYLSSAKGYRNPTLSEFFIFGANIDLLPEKLWNYEAGFNLRFYENLIDISGAFYLSEGEDFIAVTGQFPNIKNQNVGSVQNRGFELNAKIMPDKNLIISTGFNYTYMKNPIAGSPELHGILNANYSINRFQLGLNLVAIGNLYLLNNSNKFIKEDFLLLNASGGFNLNNNINLYLKINNLLDTEYQTVFGYPMPGINFLAGFTTEF
ncbi:TonB-dependent receptor [Melioribacter sp. OK-6-Me]|uniref:TonB-dependent receptor n=1 Tax=Melioribacter sp. OK-6-Me TaxID=3423433 RepID=UPI003EDA0CA7